MRQEPASCNTLYLEKHRDRTNFLLKVSYIPILICFLVFGQAAIYRIAHTPPQCSRFGWFTSSSGEYSCDHKPLDFHATLALAWLGVFCVQVALMVFGQNQLHKSVGKFGVAIIVLNVGGMFWMVIHDILHPMGKTDRPAIFTPAMVLVAVKLTLCLIFSFVAVLWEAHRDIENHALWIVRGFITSFSPAGVRFYPVILRHLAGQDCFQEHRGKFVMEAMFVSELTCAVLFSLAQLKTRRAFWDTFMKFNMFTFFAVTVMTYQFAKDNGLFLSGMIVCAAEKY